MSYTRIYTANDSSKAGATLTAQLFDATATNVGSPIGGAVERSSGMFVIAVTIPDAHSGGVEFLFDGTPYDLVSINPTGDTEKVATTTADKQAAADELLNRNLAGGGSGNSRNVRNALRFLRNKWGVTGATLSVKEEDDSTEAWAATVATDPSADPISGVDPS
jgi:hypothetical protein